MYPSDMNEPIIETTFQKYKEWLNRLSYKPGWKLTLERPIPFCQYMTLYIQYNQPNVPETFRMKNFVGPIPLVSPFQSFITISFESEAFYLSFEKFVLFIKREVINCETHEINEWLRIDGKFVTNPHPEMGKHIVQEYPETFDFKKEDK